MKGKWKPNIENRMWYRSLNENSTRSQTNSLSLSLHRTCVDVRTRACGGCGVDGWDFGMKCVVVVKENE